MSLIKSISGIRGTIGGAAGEGLTPLDVVKFTSAFATLMRRSSPSQSNTIVVGRDARLSGRMVLNTVIGTLTGMGFDVVNIGLATTPTTELAVVGEKACGGIIITASHNPKQWNALKLLNHQGEFLSADEGAEVLRIAHAEDFDYADVDHLGREKKLHLAEAAYRASARTRLGGCGCYTQGTFYRCSRCCQFGRWRGYPQVARSIGGGAYRKALL